DRLLACAIHRDRDPIACLDALPLEAVCQIHLTLRTGTGKTHAIDVSSWALYRETIERLGPLPTRVGCVRGTGDWLTLRAEVARADAVLAREFSLA
ncbi:MAG: hypothetical protein JWL62_1607, partial [Hyphomicrobiales bacterium]|nr:hypothetical protein [Hyphomicrobiales bacterium]